MKRFIVFILLLALVPMLYAKAPKYVFLFIGDGMAAPQRMIAEEFSKTVGRGPLAMNHFDYHATTRTSSANAMITDSAAAATAIACGEKTNNGMIGLDPNGKVLQSSAEFARDKGFKVGIISTVYLNHATPAGFYGHRRNRGQYYDLALDLVASKFDFFGGGGIAKYDQAGKTNIYDLAKEAGYSVSFGKDGLKSLEPGKKVIALASRSRVRCMPYAINADEKSAKLADVVEAAIKVLDNPKGFFMMVEGGAIDWAGHANEAAANLHDVLALDDAVKTALEFYKKHPSETLIIVTGDHETGAMTMGFAGSGSNMNLKLLAGQKISIGDFSDLCKKAAADKKTFEDMQAMITEYFGLKFSGDHKKDPTVVTKAELAALEKAFKDGKLANAVRQLMNRKAGIGWNSGSHTALPVLTTSIGCGASNFTGFIENTDISKKIKALLSE